MAVFRTEYRLDVFMKRIVLLVGGVETLAYFSIQMGNEWKRMGYKVFYFDLEDEMNSAKKLRRFIKPCLSRLTLKVWKKRQAFTVKALAMYGMNMQFRVTTSPSIIRIITMRDLLIFRKNITTSASTGCMRLILNIFIRSLCTVDFFRLQEADWKNYVN